MNNISHTPKFEPKPHHGTVTSYTIGFLLSLIFTVIPYDLVVHKSLSKNMLLATILGFALLQVAVQMLFFLHLGREKKPRWNLFFLASTIGIILLVVVGSLWIMSHLSHGMSSLNVTDKVATEEAVYQVNGVQAGTCPGGSGTNHRIVLLGNVPTPRHTNAHICDTLTIMTQDNVMRDVMFGSRAKAETYAGETSTSVSPEKSAVIRLTQLGVHAFHDRKVNGLTGDFTVTR
ncbi:MAG TPA: cytochrome o ubiquinol oxidase subunit IV [Patescibacteria group bacterium]|nr:cytochrome o ubiquinol oxidase subunit IV [Patescibacteria group bacterium]